MRISIVCITFLLLMIGIVMVYSSSAIYAGETYGDSLFFLKRHLLFFIIGLILSFLVMSMDADYIKEHARHVMGLAMLLLVLVLIPGIGRLGGGARRWIDLGLFNIQPSEIAKIAVIIYIADFIERRETRVNNFFGGYLPPLITLGCVISLILLEPDLGTAITVGIIGMLLLFIAGAALKHLFLTVLLTIPFVCYLIFSTPYRKRRILAFINPWLDEQGTGFQIVQSFIALGSGGLFGVGVGQSKQKLFFLPAAHTDFVFSIIGEELGFIGVLCVVILFFVLMWQGARAAFKVEDPFRKMLIFGVVFTIAFEVIVNIGVSSGFFPTKGLPLPFISYGGTSLVMHMVAIALLLNATRE